MQNSFENDLQIDKFSLDDEWLNQSILYYTWSKNQADAVAERDKAKQQLELTKSQLDVNIRSFPDRYKIEKVTEAAVQNTIIADSSYQEALSEYQTAVYNVNVLSGGLEALNHKKYALENLTKLFLSGYWTEARVQNNISSDSREKQEKQIHTEQEKMLSASPKFNKLKRK
jgi:hypothetical protein